MSVVASNRELHEFCARAAGLAFCAVDTEFRWQQTYWPEPSLIQLATPSGDVAIIDLLATNGLDLAPLRQLLTSAQTTKVLHAARQDVQILYRLLGDPMTPVFDTQIGAALVGLGYQISFAQLAQTLAGVQLDKNQQYTDWLVRPLSDAQLRYAADDVRHLVTVYQRLEERLRTVGALAWAQEDSMALCAPALLATVSPDQAHRELRGIARLPPPARGAACALAEWREHYCQSINLRPCRVLPDALLLKLAAHGTLREGELRQLRRSVAKRLRQLLPELSRVIDSGRHRAPQLDPGLRRRAGSAAVERQWLLEGIELLVTVAEELRIEREALATRADLLSFVRDWLRDATVHDSRLLTGWRREAIGTRLLELARSRWTPPGQTATG